MRLFNRVYVNVYAISGFMLGFEFDTEFTTEVTINLGIFKVFINWAKNNKHYPLRDLSI